MPRGVSWGGSALRVPNWNPTLTYGGAPQPVGGFEPGPSGPIPDSREFMPALFAGPWHGRAVRPVNAFGPNLSILGLWPQMVVNNSFATAQLALYVPGWLKRPSTDVSF